MKLQLYINDLLFNEMHLPDILNNWDEIAKFSDDGVNFRRHVVEDYAEELKCSFADRISKAKKWEILLVAESKMNLVMEIEAV